MFFNVVIEFNIHQRNARTLLFPGSWGGGVRRLSGPVRSNQSFSILDLSIEAARVSEIFSSVGSFKCVTRSSVNQAAKDRITKRNRGGFFEHFGLDEQNF
ncbi:hypothetical protein J2D73_12605 [Acetobacter sacchari]|uniref:Uncharacterized protein n=1 Tax=Acetobacter sacchari TaxID=2661687 RepID=A0ABS3LXJ6_9PROT|nr:hypothetical protein [Acetobacter sacchari]MBO1360629.1 hypothetical protein [Acetobacter sacchari]